MTPEVSRLRGVAVLHLTKEFVRIRNSSDSFGDRLKYRSRQSGKASLKKTVFRLKEAVRRSRQSSQNGTVSFAKIRWWRGPTGATVIGLGTTWGTRKRPQRCRSVLMSVFMERP